MNNCPCCSGTLLRHIRDRNVYWFCRNCWQVMPILGETNFRPLSEVLPGELPKRRVPAKTANLSILLRK